MPEDGYERIEIKPSGMPEVPELDDLLGEKPELPDPPVWQYERPAENAPSPLQSGDLPATYSRGMGLAFAIGSSFLGPVLAGLLIGYLIDGKAGGTAGTIGLLLGTVVAFVLLIRLVSKLNESG